MGKLLEESFLRLNRNDPVITVSESTRDELVSRGYHLDKIKVIHNGVFFTPWKREQWCEKEKAPTFIYAGRYSPYKGINVAVNALAKIKKNISQCETLDNWQERPRICQQKLNADM